MAQDVLGGQFAWRPDRKVWYLAPDTLRWENTDRGYGDWLAAMLGGGMTGYYEDLRWPGWAEESEACRLDQAISIWPPPWTREGKDVGAASRRPVPMAEAMSLLGVGEDQS